MRDSRDLPRRPRPLRAEQDRQAKAIGCAVIGYLALVVAFWVVVGLIVVHFVVKAW